MPDRLRRLGAAGMARAHGAPHYAAMVLCFWCFLFLQNRRSARNSPRGLLPAGGGAPEQDVRCGDERPEPRVCLSFL
jgi:hypothetical protein